MNPIPIKPLQMSKSLEAITRDVLELPNSQRLLLARIILDFDGDANDPDAEAAWDAEIRTRLKAYDEGRLETLPYEEFRVRMQEQFGR